MLISCLAFKREDRTLTAVIPVKEWVPKENLEIAEINFYSGGVHSCRSWLLYKKVFEPEIKVGVIAHAPTAYDANVWWQ